MGLSFNILFSPKMESNTFPIVFYEFFKNSKSKEGKKGWVSSGENWKISRNRTQEVTWNQITQIRIFIEASSKATGCQESLKGKQQPGDLFAGFTGPRIVYG